MEQWINLTCALGLTKYADLNNSRLFRKISEDLRRFLKICEELSTLFWSSYSHVKDILFTDTQIRYDTDAIFFQKKIKKTSKHLTIFFPETVNTVNSLYSGHCRDLKLVSSVARVRNSGSLFQSNVCNFFLPGIYLLSVLSGSPL